MTRSKWAVLGLSALALLAMSALVAPGAQGNKENPEFTCIETLEPGHTEEHVGCTATAVTAKVHRKHNGEFSEVHTYTTGAGTITCKSQEFHVTTDADGTNPTPEAEPTYKDCQANPGHNQVHVATNGCHFKFHPKDTSGETKEEDEYTGTAQITCPVGNSITVTVTNNTFTEPTNEEGATKCLIHIPPQEGIGPIYFRTHTKPNTELTDMTVEAKTANVTAKFTGGFFNCGVFGEHGNTAYTGNTTVQAKNHKGELIDLELD